jgi:LacI family transcriptional regulator
MRTLDGNLSCSKQVQEMSAPTRRNGGQPPTLRDIAKASGCSLTTVSLALRDSPQIAVATRERVKQVAKSLGYTPNPLAAAFHSEIRKRQSRRYKATVAWINDSPDAGVWRGHPMFIGARERCAELGYVLDEIHIDTSDHMHEPEYNAARFRKVLRSRGIHAAILPDLFRRTLAVEDWGDLSVVLIGHFNEMLRVSKVTHGLQVPYHTVAPDNAWNLWLAFNQLEQRGCRRIGLTIGEWTNMSTGRSTFSRYLDMQQSLPAARRVPPHILMPYSADAPQPVSSWKAEFLQWLDKQRPDAVICENHEVFEWVRERGRKVPGDLRIAHLDVDYEGPAVSGINRRRDRLGEAAVDLVTSHLQRNETGIPPFPKKMLIPGEWREGTTA